MTKWQNGENEERKVQTWIDKIKYIQYDDFVLVKIDQIQLDKHKQTCWGDVFELLLPWKPLKRVAKQHNFESLMRLSHLGDLASVCQKYEKIETYAGVRPIRCGYVLYTLRARWHTSLYVDVRWARKMFLWMLKKSRRMYNVWPYASNTLRVRYANVDTRSCKLVIRRIKFVLKPTHCTYF